MNDILALLTAGSDLSMLVFACVLIKHEIRIGKLEK